MAAGHSSLMWLRQSQASSKPPGSWWAPKNPGPQHIPAPASCHVARWFLWNQDPRPPHPWPTFKTLATSHLPQTQAPSPLCCWMLPWHQTPGRLPQTQAMRIPWIPILASSCRPSHLLWSQAFSKPSRTQAPGGRLWTQAPGQSNYCRKPKESSNSYTYTRRKKGL